MRVMRLLHKWLGLIVGLQLLIWMVSGLVFAWLDHDAVTAEHSVRARPAPRLARSASLVEPDAWLAEYTAAELIDVTLMPLLDQWVYRVRLTDRIELRRAEDGSRFAIGEAMARRLATATYGGIGVLQRVAYHATPPIEARGAGAVWQAAFDDSDRTSLFFSAADGRLVAARNTTWRWFDFFWMLHTMDYRGRDDFNNPLVILVGTGALWLGISGIMLLWRAFVP